MQIISTLDICMPLALWEFHKKDFNTGSAFLVIGLVCLQKVVCNVYVFKLISFSLPLWIFQ